MTSLSHVMIGHGLVDSDHLITQMTRGMSIRVGVHKTNLIILNIVKTLCKLCHSSRFSSTVLDMFLEKIQLKVDSSNYADSRRTAYSHMFKHPKCCVFQMTYYELLRFSNASRMIFHVFLLFLIMNCAQRLQNNINDFLSQWPKSSYFIVSQQRMSIVLVITTIPVKRRPEKHYKNPCGSQK